MACDPLITDPFEFPRRPNNRPGLPCIAYRIGRYADFVEAMTRAINLAPELAAWTHRDPDDPGIALHARAGRNNLLETPGKAWLKAISILHKLSEL